MSVDPFSEQNRQIEELMRTIKEPQLATPASLEAKPMQYSVDWDTGTVLERNPHTGLWGLPSEQQQDNIIASHEAANEEMDAEKDLMRVFLEDAEREFRRCKQEPAFANWALRFGLKIIQTARGELKWQVSTE